MIAVGALGLSQGDPRRLVYGTDYAGKTCGVDELKARKHLMFPRANEDFLVNLNVKNPLDYKLYGVCVEECPANARVDESTGERIVDIVCNDEVPDRTTTGVEMSWYNYALTTSGKASLEACLTDYDDNSAECQQARRNCWIVPLPTSSILWRCIPKYEYARAENRPCVYPSPDAGDACLLVEVDSTQQTVQPAKPNYLFERFNQASSVWGRYFADVREAWWVILLVGGLFALSLGFIMTLFLKFAAGLMVWLSVVLSVLVMFALTLYFYFKGGVLSNEVVPDSIQDRIDSRTGSEGTVSQTLSTSEDYKLAFRIAAYVGTALCVIVLVLIVALRNAINTAIIVVKKASAAVNAMPTMVFFPLVTVFWLIALLIYWVFIAAAMAAAGEITTQDVTATVDANLAQLEAQTGGAGWIGNFTTSAEQSFKTLEDIDWMKYMLAYHFFGLLWTNQFIQGISMIAIAAAVGGWYFSKNETGEEGVKQYAQPKFAVWKSYGMALRYYMGTVAFGGFLIATVQFIRAVLAYLQKQMNERAKNNRLMKAIMCVVSCCLWCIQKVLEVVSRNAYVYVAIKGYGFCTAGYKAFHLILRNMSTLAVVNLLGEIIMFLCKVLVTALCGWVAFWMFDSMEMFQEGGSNEISSAWLPVLITMIFAFFVSAGFFYTFDMTMDTILVCYVMDKEEHGGRAVHITSGWLTAARKSAAKGAGNTTSRASSADSAGEVEMRAAARA
jgi:choline transporter-like protein 2/4/5